LRLVIGLSRARRVAVFAMGRKVEESPIRVRGDAVKISIGALILGWLFKTVVKLLIVILRSPTAICMLSLVAITWLVHRGLGLAPVLMGCGFLLLGIGLLGGGSSRCIGSGGRRRWTPPASSASAAACSTTNPSGCLGPASSCHQFPIVQALPQPTSMTWALM